MEIKTKKRLINGIIFNLSGIIMFYLAVKFWLPIIGIIGTVFIFSGSYDMIAGTFYGILEKITYNKQYKK